MEKNTAPDPWLPEMQGSSQKCRAALAAVSSIPCPQKPFFPDIRFAWHCRGQSVQSFMMDSVCSCVILMV